MQIDKWDYRFLSLSRTISDWSKDPSTKCGSVITRPDNTICSLGFNGFPSKIDDDDRLLDRNIKYSLIIHAEMNAILSAKENLVGYTIYVWPQIPCSNCAKHIIQTGITRVVYGDKLLPPNWEEDSKVTKEMFIESGVDFFSIDTIDLRD